MVPDYLPAENAATKKPEADDLHHVPELLDKFDKREAMVLRMRFGLDKLSESINAE
jgi:DNA-directed RNA polymerase sigma subunit (sigma70/sigma32)